MSWSHQEAQPGGDIEPLAPCEAWEDHHLNDKLLSGATLWPRPLKRHSSQALRGGIVKHSSHRIVPRRGMKERINILTV